MKGEWFMFKLLKKSQTGKFALSALVATSFFISGSVIAEEELIGSAEYLNSCASCHGEGAKGDGNLGKYLNITPTDLTMLSKNNDGTYPFLRVFQTIDGRADTSGHGDRLMPVWGDRYSMDIGDKYGPFGGEAAVRARVLELVYYIQNMQQK